LRRSIIDNGIEDLAFRTKIMIQRISTHHTRASQFTPISVVISFVSEYFCRASNYMIYALFD
jgi:hypothetical protein